MSARHDAPDLPRVPVPDTSELRQTAYDAFANKDTHTPEGEREDEARPLQGSPVIASRPPRRPSVSGSHSHVELDHFDPDGMTALRRTMSRASESVAHPGRSPVLPVARPTSQTSDATLAAGDGPFDFEKTLRYFVQRREKEDIKSRELGVVFTDLEVIGLGASANYQETFASFLDPRSILQGIQAKRHPPVRNILSGFNGVVRPGEMLLVLGRPGSGCSTLLKTLANQRGEFHAVTGDVRYDAFSPAAMEAHYRGDLLYSPEDDVHFPTLTVDETLRFAAKTRAPHARSGGMSRAEYTRTMVDVLETLFGLRHVKDTPVGDNRIRGVSGGEKKRVSIAEALATRALLAAWDNSTRGLDASTALEFVRALRIATDVARLTTVVSIYQAGEQLYELFDKVCVIYEGQMAYMGPAREARQYFIDMGYEPANRQTTADFLVAVTDSNGRTRRKNVQGPLPGTALEFAKAFRESELGRANQEDIASYTAQFTDKNTQRASAFVESTRTERAKHTRAASPYTISIPMQARAVMVRRLQIIKGSIAELLIQVTSFILQGIIVGTVFLKLPESTSAFFSRGGVLFFSLLFAALSTMAEIPALFGQRPIVERHNRSAMYHPFIEGLALTLVDVPITFIQMLVFSVIIYELVQLQQSAGQFFIFFLFVFIMTITMRGWFRMLASAFKSPAPAQTIAGLSTLALSIYTGYTIPRPSMIGALRWITYLNPLRFGFEAVLTNEFHTLDGTCASIVPQGPGYENIGLANQVCASVGSQPGQSTVNGNTFVEASYGYTYSNLWMNFGIVLAFGIGFITLLLIFTEFNTSLSGSSNVTLFKRGSKAPVIREAAAAVGSDEEKAQVAQEAGAPDTADTAEEEKAISQGPKMNDAFSWQHLNYTVPVADGKRQLLNDVSGYVVPGQLTALMGESGAGKTTLLNVLAERYSTGVVTGDRFVNGQNLPPDFQAQTGYAQQMDTHLESTTVREALLFSARLRQPRDVPDDEKRAYVESCLKMCGLEMYADAIVGSLGVEHRKRTTIAVELAAKPKLLLFLDEPTTGLDSQSAWGIVSFLRTLAKSGTAILCTIHQPSAELFQQFDRLLLLKKGGQTVYFGNLGKNATTLIDYFQQSGGRSIGEMENPAEYMLEIIGAGATAKTDVDWHEKWKTSSEAQSVQDEIEHIHADGRQKPPVEATLRSSFATNWVYQVKTLTARNAQYFWRDPTYIFSKLALNIVGGLFIGFTFFQAVSTQQGTQNKLFAVFMGLIVSVPLANQLQVPFIHTRGIYEIRERPSHMYSWTALVTSQILAELPWNLLGSSIFFFCWYWTVGFDSSRAGFTYLLLGVLVPLYYTGIGLAVAAMSPSAEIAALLFSFLFSFVLTFNGVLQPYRLLGWWQWMYHLSPYTYLISALLGQAVGHQDITCSPIEYVTLTPPSGRSCGDYMQAYISTAGGYVSNPDATSNCQFCSTRTTDEFLGGNFNIEYSTHWWHLGVFCAFILFNIFAIYGLTWLFRIRKGSMFGFIKTRLARRK